MTPTRGAVRRAPRRVFRDRREAGRVLADLLGGYRGLEGVVVLGLARGGIPVAWEVAAALGVPLDAFIVRKLGAPGHEEFAMGALASDGRVVVNDDVQNAIPFLADLLGVVKIAVRATPRFMRRIDRLPNPVFPDAALDQHLAGVTRKFYPRHTSYSFLTRRSAV